MVSSATVVPEAALLMVKVSAVAPMTEALAIDTVFRPVMLPTSKLEDVAVLTLSIALIFKVVTPVVLKPAKAAVAVMTDRLNVPSLEATESDRFQVVLAAVFWSIKPVIFLAVVLSTPVESVKVEPTTADAAPDAPAATTAETEAFNAAVAVAAVKEAAVESTDVR